MRLTLIARDEESRRITANRQHAGLCTAPQRHPAPHGNPHQRVAASQLDLAAGSLTADSEVL